MVSIIVEEQLANENLRLKEELARKTSSLLDALASLEVINAATAPAPIVPASAKVTHYTLQH